MQRDNVHGDGLDQVEKKIRALSKRDLQLWSIGLLVVLALAAGFIALVLPSLVWGQHGVSSVTSYLPQLFFGLIVLIALFNIYILRQRQELNTARQEVISELIFSQRTHNSSLLDPLTQSFNRCYLEHAIPREVALANRHGTALTIVLLDLDGFRQINARYGHRSGDELLVETAKLLRGAFTAGETVLRYGGDEFLILLPDCDGEQALEQVQQLLGRVKTWNEASGKPYRMTLSYGIAAYTHGDDINQVLAAAEETMIQHRKQNHSELARKLQPECLVISADEQALRVLEPTLNSMSVGVENCANATDALERLARRRFEAVIIDDEMKGGDELRAQVRALPSTRNAVMVALVPSGNGGARPGASFVLEKPLDTSNVARGLRVMQTLMLAERQRYFRHPCSLPVMLRLNPATQYFGIATDLSEGGMAVRSDNPLPAGAVGVLNVKLPQENKQFEAKAEIVWSDSQGRAGLRILEMSKLSRAALHQWLQENTQQMLGAQVAQRFRRVAGL